MAESLPAADEQTPRTRLADNLESTGDLPDAVDAHPSPTNNADLGFLDPPVEPGEIGRLDGFPILDVLGKGGMGVVLLAVDPKLGRKVAIKVIRADISSLPLVKERFLHEARSAAEVEHERIVAIYHVGEFRELPYLVMPLLRGESLGDRLKRDKQLPVADVLRLGREMAEGLDAAHARGLVHRDIKPANIWLETQADGAGPSHVKLLDFGLARCVAPTRTRGGDLTQPGAIMGTPAYMAPEQFRSASVDSRADLFSLGVVLFEMCTGRRPFDHPGNLTDNAEVSIKPRASNPAVPERLSSLISRLLASAPEDRPQSAAQVVEELKQLEAGSEGFGETPAQETKLFVPAQNRARRRWLAAAVAALLVVSVGIVVWQIAAKQLQPTQTATDFKGWLDVRLTSAKDRKFDRSLLHAEALPVRENEQFRLEAKVEPAGYLYILGFDEDGKVTPFYPWQPGEWGSRPADENRLGHLILPPSRDGEAQGFRITGTAQGMLSFIMLVRTTPLDLTDDTLKALIGVLPAQRPMPSLETAIWFENGRIVQKEPDRQVRGFEVKGSTLENPVARFETLMQKLQGHASYTRGVTFAKVGK